MSVAVVLVIVAALAGPPVNRWRRGRVLRRRLGIGGRRPEPTDRPGLLEQWLGSRLRAADLDWSTAVVARGVAGAVVGVAVVVLAGRPGVAVVALLGAAGAVAALHLARDRRAARLEAELPALLEAVARALRSGAALPVALQEAAAGGSAAADELDMVLSDGARGLGLTEALDRWAERRPRPAVRLVVGALTVALVAGGSPARGVDGVAATLRERAEVEREARSLATQARASAVVVTLAPVGFGALGALGDEGSAGFLLGSPAGLACLLVGLLLDAAGAVWMHRIAQAQA